LDTALTHWADTVAATTGADRRDTAGAGAAGGVGFAALAILDATLVPGIELILNLADFANHLSNTDLVITGEGTLDEQTLHGKAPAGVATAAQAAAIPVIAVCGQNTLAQPRLHAAGFTAAYSLSSIEPDITRCFTEGKTLLKHLGTHIATHHLPQTAIPPPPPPNHQTP
ncbi:glycerate kinase, partial [Nocardia sp. NPDC057030]